MNLTNAYNLPDSLFRALSYDGYDKGNRHSDISTTTLIGPPLIRQLKKRHAERITEDAADRIWSLLGQAAHVVIERAEGKESIAEERLYMDVLGWTLSGQIDLYEKEVISDFKITSVYSFMLGEKEDWVNQCNTNSALMRHSGFPVNGLQIVAILKDWSRRKAEFDPDYPQVPVIVKPMPLWPNEKCLNYIEERIKVHQEAEILSDSEIPICTPIERWRKEDSYAIIADKNKRATAVVKSEEEANQRMAFLSDKNPKKKFRIEYRPAEDTRCLNFCSVAHLCRYGRQLFEEKRC